MDKHATASLYILLEMRVKDETHYRLLSTTTLHVEDAYSATALLVALLLQNVNGFPLFDCAAFTRNRVMREVKDPASKPTGPHLYWEGKTYSVEGLHHGTVELTRLMELLEVAGAAKDKTLMETVVQWEEVINREIDTGTGEPDLSGRSFRMVYFSL